MCDKDVVSSDYPVIQNQSKHPVEHVASLSKRFLIFYASSPLSSPEVDWSWVGVNLHFCQYCQKKLIHL